MPITKEKLYKETFVDGESAEVSFSVRENGETGWYEPSDLQDIEGQKTKPTKETDLNRVVEESDGAFIDKDGKVFAYECQKIPMKVEILLDTSVEKLIRQAIKSLIINIQTRFRQAGTAWCLEHTNDQKLKASDLCKGKVELTLSAQVGKLLAKKEPTQDEIDKVLEMLTELRTAELKNAKS